MSSFTLAGESLGLPRSTVSEHVQALETAARHPLAATHHAPGSGDSGRLGVVRTQQGLAVAYGRHRGAVSPGSGFAHRADSLRYAELPGPPHGDAAACRNSWRCTPIWNLKSAPRIAASICSGKALIVCCGSARNRISRWSLVACAILPWSIAPAPLICSATAFRKRLADLTQHQMVHYVGVLGSRFGRVFCMKSTASCIDLPMAGSITVNSTDAYEAGVSGGIRSDSGAAQGHAIALAAAVSWWRCYLSSMRRRWRCRCSMPGNGICRCGSECSWTGWQTHPVHNLKDNP